MAPSSLRLVMAATVSLVTALIHWPWAALAASLLTVLLCWIQRSLTPRWLLAGACSAALLSLAWCTGVAEAWGQPLWQRLQGSSSLLSDLGQLVIAVLALVITLRQFSVERVIIKELNLITQAQLVDSFIQGVSDMVSDGDGFLEDWPLERMLIEGRLAALLASVDATAKARVLRFLSHSGLLTPLQRDQRVGKPMLDGRGTYVVNRAEGVPVVQLRELLVGMDLSGTDLSGVDFNGADLRGTRMRHCNLRQADFSRCDLSGADLEGALLEGTRFFAGEAAEATPAAIDERADWISGRGTGARCHQLRFAGARQLNPETRAYLIRWQRHSPRTPKPIEADPSNTPSSG